MFVVVVLVVVVLTVIVLTVIVLTVIVLVVVVLVMAFFVMVVSVVVSPAHHGNGDVEHLHVLCIKFEDVVTGFKVVDVDDGARWTG